MGTAVTAHMILSSRRRVEAIRWPADSAVSMSQEHQSLLSLSGVSNGVLPCEYAKAASLLGLSQYWDVAPYTIRTTKTHVYKVWLREGIPVDSTVHPCFKLNGLRSERVWIGDGVLVRYQKPREPPQPAQASYTQHNLCSPTDMDMTPDELAVEFLEQRANDRRELFESTVRIDDGLITVHTEDGPHSCEVCRRPTKSKCSKCRSVYYCSAEHQRAHWPEHKPACAGLSTSPAQPVSSSVSGSSSSVASETHQCAVCQQPSKSKCGKCKGVYYCGRDHQAAHWPAHKSSCIER